MNNKSSFTIELLNFFVECENQKFIYGFKQLNEILLFKVLIEMQNSEIYNYIYDNSLMPYDALMNSIDKAMEVVKKEEIEDTIRRKNNPKLPPDELFTVTISNTQNKDTVKITFNKDASEVAKIAVFTAVEREENIDIWHFQYAIMNYMPRKILEILRTTGVDTSNIKKTFKLKDSSTEITLSKELASFTSILNKNFVKGQKPVILGRDEECEHVWETLEKKTKRNVILVGEPGVGKSSIVKRITQDIVNENCPESFKGFSVISVDVNSSIAGTMYRGQAEERFAQLIHFLDTTPNVILFIDEIHTILGAGACKDGQLDFANALKPMLAEDKIRVIGATTSTEYEKYFKTDGALTRRFRPIKVEEPKGEKIYEMIKGAVKELSNYHKVKINKDMINYIIDMADKIKNETRNPDKTLDLIDISMVKAKRKGLKSVTKSCVSIEYFEEDIKKTKKIGF